MKLIIGITLFLASCIAHAGLILKIESEVVIQDLDKNEYVTTDALFGWSVNAQTEEIFDVFLSYDGQVVGEGGTGNVHWGITNFNSGGYQGGPCYSCIYIGGGNFVFSNGIAGSIYEMWVQFIHTESPYGVITTLGDPPVTYVSFTRDGTLFNVDGSSGNGSVTVLEVPEPAALSLLALGLAAIGIRRRLR